MGSSRESEENRELFQQLLEQPLLEMIREEMWEDIRTSLETILPENVDCVSLVTRLQAMADFR